MSNDTVRVAVVGAAGAFGMKHLDGLANIPEAEVTVVSGTKPESARQVAEQYGVPNAVVGLEGVLERDDVDAVILATPTHLHAEQAMAVLAAGKHVQVEIPLADSLADAEAALAAAEASDKVAMVGHTRRFNPSHQWVHRRITAGTSRCSRWTCRPTSSGGRTSTRRASRAAGPTTSCGTTRRTRWTCSRTRRGGSWRRTRCRGRSTPSWGSRWT